MSSGSTGPLSADDLARIVRAGNPRPGAWTELDGGRVKVLRAVATANPPPGAPGDVDATGNVVTGAGGLQLVEVQPAGKAAMPTNAWLAGRHGASTRFDS